MICRSLSDLSNHIEVRHSSYLPLFSLTQIAVNVKTRRYFILFDSCYWCATYFDKTKVPIDNICPECSINNNESFTFGYNEKRGVESEFKLRCKRP
jgi:hypothetical protein